MFRIAAPMLALLAVASAAAEPIDPSPIGCTPLPEPGAGALRAGALLSELSRCAGASRMAGELARAADMA